MDNNLGLETYIEIKDREKNINNKLDELNTERVELIERLNELKSKYPNIVVEPLVIDVIKFNIQNSSISEEEKQAITTEVENVFGGLKENVGLTNQLLSVKKDKIDIVKNERMAFLEEKYNEVMRFEKRINELRKAISERDKLLNDENRNFEPVERETILKIRNDFANELSVLYTRVREYKVYAEEIEVYNKDIKKNAKKIVVENVKKLEENDVLPEVVNENENVSEEINKQESEFVQSEISEEKQDENELTVIENKEEKEEEKPELSEVDESTLEPVIPEKPKKVKKKHKASLELINAIKKFGGVSLGIVAIGVAVAAIIANPLIVAGALGTKYLWDQAKTKSK